MTDASGSTRQRSKERLVDYLVQRGWDYTKACEMVERVPAPLPVAGARLNLALGDLGRAILATFPIIGKARKRT